MLSPVAKNLERKFDRGEEVLYYFDVQKARVINPKSKELVVTTKFACRAKRTSNHRLAVLRSPDLVQRGRWRYSKNSAIDRYFWLSSRMRCSKW
jgi:hypothetical protein